jgi:hypothetical protein
MDPLEPAGSNCELAPLSLLIPLSPFSPLSLTNELDRERRPMKDCFTLVQWLTFSVLFLRSLDPSSSASGTGDAV